MRGYPWLSRIAKSGSAEVPGGKPGGVTGRQVSAGGPEELWEYSPLARGAAQTVQRQSPQGKLPGHW